MASAVPYLMLVAFWPLVIVQSFGRCLRRIDVLCGLMFERQRLCLVNDESVDGGMVRGKKEAERDVMPLWPKSALDCHVPCLHRALMICIVGKCKAIEQL